MSDEPVFRFLTVRPADSRKKRDRESAKTPLYPESLPQSDFHQLILRLSASGADRAQFRRASEEFQKGQRYIRSLSDLPFDAQRGLDWVQAHIDRPIGSFDAAASLRDLYGTPATDLASSSGFVESLGRVADTLLAESLNPARHRSDLDQLAAAHKFMTFVMAIAANSAFDSGTTVGDAVARRVIVIPSAGKLPQDNVEPPAPPPPAPDPKDKERERLLEQLVNLEKAHRELSDVATNPKALVQPRRAAAAEVIHEATGRDTAERRRGDQRGRPANVLAGSGSVVLSSGAVSALSETTRRSLVDLRADVANMDPVAATRSVERELTIVGAQLASAQAPISYIMLGGVQLDATKLKTSLGIHGGPQVVPPPNLSYTCDFMTGVGDLLMVKQKLKAYELAEFAHVENVLASETRDREHRRLTQRETTEVAEQETETTKERDLQTTDRNEMQSEAEKTVKSQFGLEAGLQVSGSYGPTVNFSASLNSTFSTSAEESQRKSVTFSKEVTQKTSEQIRQRVRTQVTQRVLEEIQEINKHSFDNSKGTSHIRGIYRWLNKIYDAQIFNYGQRMMYEFVVPEPAAFFLYAMIENPPKDTELVKPDPPTYFGAPLKPSHLTRGNYVDFVAKYQVRNVPPPPAEFQHVSYIDKQDKVEDGTDFGRAGTIALPDGYEAYAATVMTDYIFSEGDHAFTLMLGNRNFDRSNHWGSDYQDLGARYKQLSVAYLLWNVWSFTIGVDVYCRVAADAFAKWQQQVFDAITEAYLRLKSDYDEKVAASSIRQGVPILGRNPLENVRIIREELKKLVVIMLTGSNDIALDSFYSSSEPFVRPDKACENGSRIRFFENAFEWNNMMYVLYSYFWGRRPRWISAVHFTDPDADFAAFLRAGAARVQVPVRPGFEQAVAHFCQFQQIWDGNDPPLRDDDLYVPIVDEIAANLGKFDDGVPYPPGSVPWEVRIPTDLVLLENLEEVPNIRDILTGATVTLKD